MRFRKIVITLFLSLLLFSCSTNFSPVSPDQQKITPQCGCDTAGIYIEFVDTCSYDFVISFLAEYDSVTIIDTLIGIDLFLYADSGNTEYWLDYFKDDSLFFSLSSYTQSDSLILIFRFLNEEYYQNYKDNLINHRNLHFEKSYNRVKSVLVKVPNNSEMEWINYFEQFAFIEFVGLLLVCWGG